MKGPPSKQHDPRGYAEWYAAKDFWNFVVVAVIAFLLYKGCA